MELQEFYNEFNILYNNIMSNKSPSLDEYEVSTLLTLAQEEIVISLYKGSPITGVSFEGTEEARRYIANLIKNYIGIEETEYEGLLSGNSKAFTLPEDLLFITEEHITIDSDDDCLNNKQVMVIPTKQDEVFKILNNPFRKPNEYRALRLDLSSNMVEIISPYSITYKIRYLAKPRPIIIKDLSEEGITINGQTEESNCELDPSLHRTIIKRAVDIAKKVYSENV